MTPKSFVRQESLKAIKNVFNIDIENVEIQITKQEFEGDCTLVIFPLIKTLKQKPEEIGQKLGEYLVNTGNFTSFNIVKGFLNLSLKNDFFIELIKSAYQNESYGFIKDNKSKIMVEYCSPNTNKPLHLGHVRNNLLGLSVSNILKAAGNEVLMSQIVNDRGIHICKSMLAWKRFGKGETPESSNIKGDHLVGKYYVAFDKAYQEEIKDLISKGTDKEEAKKKAPILLEAQEMLKKWEEEDSEIRELWKMMNSWVYDGFAQSYKRLGVYFDVVQYESNTYILGKDIIEKGLKDGILYKKEDGSVWADLTDEGLDEKLLLRSDGTAVYMTQDLGTAVERSTKYHLDKLIYTVGNEQDYHFQVLFLILKKLGYEWAYKLEHLSYGMVNLPEGKMKSREGTVVDADDLMQEMFNTAKEKSKELGKLEDYTKEEQENIFELIGEAALKYHILKVEAKKSILFDPKESIDFNGNTGPFIQYAYARIQSVMRKVDSKDFSISEITLNDAEKDLIKTLTLFSEVIEKSANTLNPSLVANYVFDVVKSFNFLYQNLSILNAEKEEEKQNRLAISLWASHVIKNALFLLGIGVPQRM